MDFSTPIVHLLRNRNQHLAIEKKTYDDILLIDKSNSLHRRAFDISLSELKRSKVLPNKLLEYSFRMKH